MTVMQSAILDQLTVIANEWRWLAAAWHIIIVAIVTFGLLQRARQRTIAMLLVLPLISVSAMAAWAGNPFNAIVFMVLALVLARAAMRVDDRRSARGSPLQVTAGIVVFAFGFVYPHFLITQCRVEYVYMSPFGLLPCPTLAVVTGVSLVFGVFASRRWAGTLMIALIVYGGIGAVVLGVWIDTMLIAAAAPLYQVAITEQQSGR